MHSPSAAKHDLYFRKMSFQFQACLPALCIKDLRQAVLDVPGIKSARVQTQQHLCEYSGDICSSANTAGSTNCSLQTLQITHLPGLAAPTRLRSHTHTNSISQYARLSSWGRACSDLASQMGWSFSKACHLLP